MLSVDSETQFSNRLSGILAFATTPPDLLDALHQVRQAIAKLTASGSSSATILDRNPDSNNPTWFPRKIRELVRGLR